jgi:hypothetical protein
MSKLSKNKKCENIGRESKVYRGLVERITDAIRISGDGGDQDRTDFDACSPVEDRVQGRKSLRYPSIQSPTGQFFR